MSGREFDIIAKYFSWGNASSSDGDAGVLLGSGDDAAILTASPDEDILLSTDMQLSGRHFPETASPAQVASKTFFASLSDLAAMGASPWCATLALSLPNADEEWLSEFSQALKANFKAYGIKLVGGDITKGTLTTCYQVMGKVPKGQALLRSGARPGDKIFVTGTLGDAAAALSDFTLDDRLTARYFYPTPRIAVGERLREFATSAIDVSDGLLADLSHILKASQVGATIYADKLPYSDALSQHFDMAKRQALALTGGDDYELCFTVPKDKVAKMMQCLSAQCAMTEVGDITEGSDLHVLDDNKQSIHFDTLGFSHF